METQCYICPDCHDDHLPEYECTARILKAENASLREALEKIAAVSYGAELSMNPQEWNDHWSELAVTYMTIARKALAEATRRKNPQDE